MVQSSETPTTEALEPSPGSSTDEEELNRLDEQRRQSGGESASSVGTSAPDHVLGIQPHFLMRLVGCLQEIDYSNHWRVSSVTDISDHNVLTIVISEVHDALSGS